MTRQDFTTYKDMDRTIASLREKKARIWKKMRELRKAMNYDEDVKSEYLDKYLALNDELKGVKIMEAELVYTRNKLQ